MIRKGTRGSRRSQDDWSRLVAEQADSPLTQAAFCEAHDISVTSLQYWRRKLAGEASVPTPWVGFGTLAETTAPGWDIELDLGDGICLRLRRC